MTTAKKTEKVVQAIRAAILRACRDYRPVAGQVVLTAMLYELVQVVKLCGVPRDQVLAALEAELVANDVRATDAPDEAPQGKRDGADAG